MTQEGESSFLHTLGRGLGGLIIIVLLAVALMGVILGVAKLFETEKPAIQPLPSSASASPSSAPSDAAHRARMEAKFAQPPVPYAPEPWPSYPGRRGKGASASGAGGSSAPATAPPPPSVPVGISPEDYQAAVASGKKVFLPDPKGECTVGGPNAGGAQSLVNCFAPQAAR